MVNIYPGDLRELVVEPGDELDTDTAVYVLCPAHNDRSRPSLRVYPNGAHCFTCGKHYHRDEFCSLFDDKHITATKLKQFTHTSHIKTAVDPKVVAAAAHDALLEQWGSAISEWLESRGINQRMVLQYGLGHNGVAYTFPVWEREGGALYTVRYRRDDAVNPKMMKYWGLRGRNDLRLYPGATDATAIVLTEGELDALLLRRYALPAYSWTNGASSIPTPEQWREAAPNLKHVILCRDQDEPGRTSSLKLQKRLTEMGMTTTDITWGASDGKDISELWQRWPDQFHRLVNEMKQHVERTDLGESVHRESHQPV